MSKLGARWHENERDDRGWRVPRENTVRDAIYRLHNFGFRVLQIAGVLAPLGISYRTVAAHLYYIRHPEYGNYVKREFARTRRRRRAA